MKKPVKPFKSRPKHKLRPDSRPRREKTHLRNDILEDLTDVWLERSPKTAG